MAFFDKRGEIFKKNKSFLNFVDKDTKFEELVMLSSSLDTNDSIQEGYYSPDEFSMRLNDPNLIEIFTENNRKFSTNIVESLGIEQNIESIRFQIKLEIEVEEDTDIRDFLTEKGFIVGLPNGMDVLRNELNSIIGNPSTKEVYHIGISEFSSTDDRIYADITRFVDKEEISFLNLCNKDFYMENYTNIKELFVSLKLVEEL